MQKTSFEQYVENKFYDKIFNAIKRYWWDNRSDFELSPDWMKSVFESSLESIAIYHVNIEDKAEMRIDFHPVVQAEFCVKGKGKYDVETEAVTLWFRLHCTGDLALGLSDFKVLSVEEFNGAKRYTDAMTDTLVPYIKNDKLDERAERILQKYYPEALAKPIYINAYKLAKRMGLEVHRCSITKDGSIFGRLYFYDGVGQIYDRENDTLKKGKVKAKTVLVDEDALFLYSVNSGNLTVAHECAHYALHRKAFEFRRLCNPKLTKIQCQVTGEATGFSDDHETSWMEYQANEMAPRLLLPAVTFKKKVEEVILECSEKNGTVDLLEVIEDVIDQLALFYKTPRTVIKSRMVDIGYEEAFGAFTFVDGHYVKPYKTSKEYKFDKKQTFSVGYQDALIAIMSNPGLHDSVGKGIYTYVDSHIVLNSSKYIRKRADGELTLTRYARYHIDECCLPFDVSFKDNYKVNERYFSYCVLNRDRNSPYEVEVKFCNGYQNSSQEKQKAAMEAELNDQRDEFLNLPRNFTEAINELKKKRGLSNIDLADMIGCHEKTISRTINQETTPRIENIVALCLALNLPPMVSEEIIRMAGVSFNQTQEHWNLRSLMYMSYGKSMDEIRKTASMMGVAL